MQLYKYHCCDLFQMCSVCHDAGATVGCLHKGCSQKFHVTCAVEAG